MAENCIEPRSANRFYEKNYWPAVGSKVLTKFNYFAILTAQFSQSSSLLTNFHILFSDKLSCKVEENKKIKKFLNIN